MTKPTSQETRLAVIANDIIYIKEKLKTIDDKIEGDFISREEFSAKFDPIQKIVYGLVSLVLISVFGALIGIVILRP